MIHRLSLCAALALASAGAPAQQADCKKFAEAIEADQKTLALGATSVGAEGARDAALAAAAASQIQSNLMLMQAAKCKLPTEPVSASYYLGNAVECNMKSRFGSRDEAAAACTTGKWERKK